MSDLVRNQNVGFLMTWLNTEISKLAILGSDLCLTAQLGMKSNLLINIKIAKIYGLSGINHQSQSFILLISVKKPG